ncbi:MAG: YkvA family protein [Actinomycetota bacterium]
MSAKRSAFMTLISVVRSRRGADEPRLGQQAKAVPRWLAATLRGRYPGTSRNRLLLLLLALGYVVSPIDFVPEVILPFLGFADDTVVLSWLAGSILAEMSAFLRWENDARAPAVVIPSEVVPPRPR